MITIKNITMRIEVPLITFLTLLISMGSEAQRKRVYTRVRKFDHAYTR